MKSAFLNPLTDKRKLIQCIRIRVYGASDEGPSHEEVQFMWTVSKGTARNSGSSYLNRVELQNGCLALAHANLFIPSTLSGSCMDGNKLDKMDLATDVYVMAVRVERPLSRRNSADNSFAYPRGRYRAYLGKLGLIGKLHLSSDMNEDDVKEEIRSVFKGPDRWALHVHSPTVSSSPVLYHCALFNCIMLSYCALSNCIILSYCPTVVCSPAVHSPTLLL